VSVKIKLIIKNFYNLVAFVQILF